MNAKLHAGLKYFYALFLLIRRLPRSAADTTIMAANYPEPDRPSSPSEPSFCCHSSTPRSSSRAW